MWQFVTGINFTRESIFIYILVLKTSFYFTAVIFTYFKHEIIGLSVNKWTTVIDDAKGHYMHITVTFLGRFL